MLMCQFFALINYLGVYTLLSLLCALRTKKRNMLKKKTALLLSAIALFAAPQLDAQNGTVSAGGTATGTGGTLTFSMGQTDYITAEGSTGTISQGLQQPYEITIITGIENKGIELSASVYPNPTADFVMLTLADEPGAEMSYSISDVQGKQIKAEGITSKQMSIAFSDLQSAIYFVRVINNNKEVKTFKIVKN
jgi:hypothetical protein